jgi:hypothetical protein
MVSVPGLGFNDYRDNDLSDRVFGLPFGAPMPSGRFQDAGMNPTGLPFAASTLNTRNQTVGLPSNGTITHVIVKRPSADPELDREAYKAGRLIFMRVTESANKTDSQRSDPITYQEINVDMASPKCVDKYGGMRDALWFKERFRFFGVLQHDERNPADMGEQVAKTVFISGRVRIPLFWQACKKRLMTGSRLFLVLRKLEKPDDGAALIGLAHGAGPRYYWRLEPWVANPGDIFQTPPLCEYSGVFEQKRWTGMFIYVGVVHKLHGDSGTMLSRYENAERVCYPGIMGMRGVTENEGELMEGIVQLGKKL